RFIDAVELARLVGVAAIASLVGTGAGPGADDGFEQADGARDPGAFLRRGWGAGPEQGRDPRPLLRRQGSRGAHRAAAAVTDVERLKRRGGRYNVRDPRFFRGGRTADR